MAEIEQADAPSVGAGPQLAQMLTLLSGSFASGFDVAAANLAMSKRQELALARNQNASPALTAALAARSAAASVQAGFMLTNLARSAAAPVADPNAAIIGGRVVDGTDAKQGLGVVALDPRGHALAQATSGPGGMFSLSLDASAEVVLMVTDAHGKKLDVDEQVIDARLGATAFREIDLSKKGPPKREKADLSDRVTMPDVTGMEVMDAASALKDQGLANHGVAFEARPDRNGVVASTDPRPGNFVETSRPVELSLGMDPAGRFDRTLVANAVKVDTGKAVPDEAVDKMFDALAAGGATGFERLQGAARKDDKAFAEMTGLPARQAARARASLLKLLAGLGTLRAPKG
jgi:hypothetical protein